MKKSFLLFLLIISGQVLAGPCLDMLNQLMSSKNLTLNKEIIVDTSIGSEFYLSSKFLGLGEEQQHYKFQVVDEHFNDSSSREWLLEIKSMDLKISNQIKIPIGQIEDNAVPVINYEKKYYEPRTGDFVGIVLPYDKKEKWRMLSFDYRDVFADKKFIPPRLKTGTFIESFDDEHSVVRFNLRPELDGELEMSLIVPNLHIANLPTMNAMILNKRIEHFFSLNFDFNLDERVRFRIDGRIYEGIIKENKKNTFVIKKLKKHKYFEINKDNVFKWNEQTPFPASSGYGNLVSELQYHPLESPETLRVLNAVAKLTSTSDYLQMKKIDQVKIITAFVMSLLEYDMKVVDMYSFGRGFVQNSQYQFGPEVKFPGMNFDYCITSGVGVCRHLSPLLAMALRESGFNNVRIGLSHSIGKKDIGHAWVELMLDNKWYIAEPSYHGDDVINFLKGKKINTDSPSFVMSLDSIRKRNDKFDQRHYLNVQNEYIRM